MKIAFYGTLMRSFDVQRRLGVEASLRYEGPCRILGELWNLGRYPALVEGAGESRGELYEIVNEGVLETLDAFEGSEYERKVLQLLEPRLAAWVYVFVGNLDGRDRVPSGCWRTHVFKSGESRSG